MQAIEIRKTAEHEMGNLVGALHFLSDSMGIVPVEGVRGCVDRMGIFRNSQNNDL